MTPFDRALEDQALRDAAEAYALRRGEPGTSEYRAAWLRFRRRFDALDDAERAHTRHTRTTTASEPARAQIHERESAR